MGAGGARRSIKKDSFQQERQGEGALNKLISTIGFLEAGIESCDWPNDCEEGALIGLCGCEKGETLTSLCYSEATRDDLQHTHTPIQIRRSITPLCVWRGVIKTSGGGRWRGNREKGGQKKASVCVSLLCQPCRQTSASLSTALHCMSSIIPLSSVPVCVFACSGCKQENVPDKWKYIMLISIHASVEVLVINLNRFKYSEIHSPRAVSCLFVWVLCEYLKSFLMSVCH